VKCIIMLIDNLGSGGAQRQIIRLSNQFALMEYDVTILTYGKSITFYEDEILDSVKTINVYSSNRIIKVLNIYRFLLHVQDAILVSFLDVPNIIACIYRFINRSANIYICERSSISGLNNSISKRILQTLATQSNALIANSYDSASAWRKALPRNSINIYTVYNLVTDIGPFPNSSYIVKHNGIVKILIAASFQTNKNISGLIIALHALSNIEREKLSIHWYGDNSIPQCKVVYENAINQIVTMNMTNCIHLHDATKDIYKHVYETDYVALFSKHEGLPNVICEALCAGKPIIMSTVSDYGILVDKTNGFLCNPYETESITRALRCAINSSPETIIGMGNASREKGLYLFNPTNNARQYMDIFASEMR
jgi:glycosyltransferase involved in cell wall biosynthesis